LSVLQRHPTVRRLVDIVFSLFFLVLATPLLLVVAVLVRLDSAGPVLFRQQRVGKDGTQYTMYKIRSMSSNVGTMSLPTGRRDPRITRVGHVIRKLRLDELPQLYNVLRGEMSILGPRPGLPRS
jgi:lipopolysaccharide/colanic/teichoic acid biosynthesis glycosyltransferase